MAQVIDLDSRRKGWRVLTWNCPKCGHKQTSAYLEECARLECGECHKMIEVRPLKELFPWIEE